jgi:diguanylate cyclase (GGDEF)-like protein
LAAWLWSRRTLAAQRQRHEHALDFARTEARTDALTGLWNRRAFDEQLALQAAIARRYDSACAVVLIDIDELKSLNDRFGHSSGDAALRRLAAVLESALREADFAARFGGDEFAVLLPQTDVPGAVCVALRLLASLNESESNPSAADEDDSAANVPILRASLGIAAILPDESATDLLRRADKALYSAKQAGGHRVWWHDGRVAVECRSDR